LSVIKSVSLDEKTAHIARNLPNFSHFVRECLLRHELGESRLECHWGKPKQFLGRCNPNTVNRAHCFICWPLGRPPKSGVSAFAYSGEITLEELDELTRQENRHILDMSGPSVQQPKKKPKSYKPLGFFEKIRMKIRDRSL